MTQVNLDGILPSATIMVVSVTGSTTNGLPLSARRPATRAAPFLRWRLCWRLEAARRAPAQEDDLGKALEAADRSLELDGALGRPGPCTPG